MQFNEWVNSLYSNMDAFYFNYFTFSIMLLILSALLIFMGIGLLTIFYDLVLKDLFAFMKKFFKACKWHFNKWVNSKFNNSRRKI